uniref:Uncharacterized protein n=1 Tax=Arundo donax TaxID=35708 RepID=A0A0A9QRQ0_ARUDO
MHITLALFLYLQTLDVKPHTFTLLYFIIELYHFFLDSKLIACKQQEISVKEKTSQMKRIPYPF